jgi:ribonuclease BN (tRNA processing enzyme)
MTVPVWLDVWGCRGSKSFAAGRSRIGNHTSCYSVQRGEDLFVFDAGRGLAVLAQATQSPATPLGRRLSSARRVTLLVTHAHMDHWEGIKDADWLWARNSGVELRILGPAQALETIRRAYSHPSFVPLEMLARGTVAELAYRELAPRAKTELGDATLETVTLNHYAGTDEGPAYLDTFGYLLTLPGGATVGYLSDHEPIAETRAMEDDVARAARALIVDAHFADVREHAFGHGSQEHAACCARRHPETLVVAGHHGPAQSDERIEEAFVRHGRGAENLALAIEGRAFAWDAGARRFVVA